MTDESTPSRGRPRRQGARSAESGLTPDMARSTPDEPATPAQPTRRAYTRREAPAVDPEIAAITIACNALAPLDPATRDRVLGYLDARFSAAPALDLPGAAPVARARIDALPGGSLNLTPPSATPENPGSLNSVSMAEVKSAVRAAHRQGGTLPVGLHLSSETAEYLVSAGLAGWPSENARNAIVLTAAGGQLAVAPTPADSAVPAPPAPPNPFAPSGPANPFAGTA